MGHHSERSQQGPAAANRPDRRELRFCVTLTPDYPGFHAPIAFMSRAAVHSGAMNTNQVGATHEPPQMSLRGDVSSPIAACCASKRRRNGPVQAEPRPTNLCTAALCAGCVSGGVVACQCPHSRPSSSNWLRMEQRLDFADVGLVCWPPSRGSVDGRGNEGPSSDCRRSREGAALTAPHGHPNA